jgi:hypothetical protein
MSSMCRLLGSRYGVSCMHKNLGEGVNMVDCARRLTCLAAASQTSERVHRNRTAPQASCSVSSSSASGFMLVVQKIRKRALYPAEQ